MDNIANNSTPLRSINSDSALVSSIYSAMVLIRLFERQVAELVSAGEIHTPCHLYEGQEAIAAGVCLALQSTDYIWGGHRSHGHYLAKGGDTNAMMAEIYGKATGCSSGRGGSMHLCAPEVGILGTVPLVAATIPLAAGSALASKLRGDARVSVAFFGDGATEEGHFYETVNLAAVYHLPLIFVCENNLYSSHLHISERRLRDNIDVMVGAYGIPSVRLDGNDAIAVHRAALQAVESARSGAGPALLECRTYRWRGHVGSSWDMDVGIKRKDELAEWLEKDPIALLRSYLLRDGVASSDLQAVEAACRSKVEAAVAFARESPFPDPSELTRHVY
jgi:acetoin:2,6-dichlorophenolindophenol oxidoreductase subunit alpha